MATISKRGENSYRISVSLGYDRQGKKITPARKTVTLDPNLTQKQKEKELDRLATLFEDEIKNGRLIGTSMTFEKYIDKWLTEYVDKNLERKTAHSYKMELKQKIIPALGHLKLKDIRPLHLKEFYNNLTEDGVRLDGKPGGYSSRTIQYNHQIISSALSCAVEWELIDSNVAQKVTPPKGTDRKRKEVNYLDDEQAIAFLEFLEEQELLYKALIYVTVHGGLRTEEVLALTWNDVNFSKNQIDINKALSYVDGEQFIKDTTKNEDSTRTITLSTEVMALLKELKFQSKTVRLFQMHYSTPYHWLTKRIEAYNKSHDVKIPKINFHGLRHTSATLQIASGLDIKTISSRLGHADPMTTVRIYGHAIKSRDKAASDAISNMLTKKKG